jgi:RNA-directed DNA polymerase
LYDKVCRADILSHAYGLVCANKGSAGIDGVTFEAIETTEGITAFVAELVEALKSKTYRPDPVKRVMIPKADGTKRPLGIPTIRDRVAQMAVKLVIEPIFEADFCDTSYGFRPKRSAHGAVDDVAHTLNKGYCEVIDADLSKYFDTIPHADLMAVVADRISDGEILRLIKMWLKASIMEEDKDGKKRNIGGGKGNRKGTPQGGPLSQLLSNILLDDLDKEMEKRVHQFARYADDLIILVKSRRAGERVMESISRFLERKLRVRVNRDKSKVVKAEESSSLGFTFTRKRLTVSEKSLARFKSEMCRLIGRSWGVSMDYRCWKIRTYLQGWMNYFGIALKYNDAMELDHWLRRRVRMCYWKQWRRARKRIGELIKLGAPRYHAILTGLSRKGYWHLSKTLSTNCGLGNEFLQKQGLTFIRTLWIQVHYPAKAR